MKNLEYCVYTYKHRKALKKVIEDCKHLSNDDKVKLLKRASIHDMDKMVMYMFWDKKRSSNYHREHASHHIDNSIEKSRLDLLETIFDYECAGITKPDKPLNAYDTMYKFYPTYENELLPLLKELNMYSSYKVVDKWNLADLSVTEKDILKEVSVYLRNNTNNICTELKDELCDYREYLKLIEY